MKDLRIRLPKSERYYSTDYSAIHLYLRRNYKKTGICEFCQEKGRTEWSNKTGIMIRDRDNWQELCKSCHRRYDIAILGVKITGRPIK